MPRPALLAVALVVALAGGAGAADLRVIRVSDGDTFVGLDSENRQIKVRLHGIDAPKSQTGLRQRVEAGALRSDRREDRVGRGG